MARRSVEEAEGVEYGMAPRHPLVTLLTDFGTSDGYVGELKGVIKSQAPEAEIIDVAHDLAPQDIESARLAVARYWRRFPAGTVHVVVVDPGVGTARPAIAVSSTERYLVGPDNGVLSPALLSPGASSVALEVPPSASATFHGRDVFAPAAAALLRGVPLSDIGDPFPSPLVRRTPEPRRRQDGGLEGEIIAIDRFGNAVTNFLALHGGRLEVAGAVLPIMHTYGDVAPGMLIAVVGSSGLVEIAQRNGSAATRLALKPGATVVMRRG
jgi:S-adenosyl-L-methionine hydrolase (adenosine-forming)